MPGDSAGVRAGGRSYGRPRIPPVGSRCRARPARRSTAPRGRSTGHRRTLAHGHDAGVQPASRQTLAPDDGWKSSRLDRPPPVVGRFERAWATTCQSADL